MSMPDSNMTEDDDQSEPAAPTQGKPSEAPQEATSSTEAEQQRPTKLAKKKACSICNDSEGKYKCARCFLPYCSIACNTVHKKRCVPAPKPKKESKGEPVSQRNGLVPQPGTVAAAGFRGPFSALDNSKELRLLFKLYPNLPAILDEVNTATLPPVNGLDGNGSNGHNGRNGSTRQRPREHWNSDRGLQNGLKALHQRRQRHDKDGEAVREYSKLVLQILSADQEMDAQAMIQKQLAEENAIFVEQLLKGEI